MVVDIAEFVNAALYELSYNLVTFKLFFKTFQHDPVRSGVFHHYRARWDAFAATCFQVRPLATGLHGTAIQGIESLPKPLFDKLEVVRWLRVSSDSCKLNY